jgi:hypothetical protein
LLTSPPPNNRADLAGSSSVSTRKMSAPGVPAPPRPPLDADRRARVDRLSPWSPEREEAPQASHGLLSKAPRCGETPAAGRFPSAPPTITTTWPIRAPMTCSSPYWSSSMSSAATGASPPGPTGPFSSRRGEGLITTRNSTPHQDLERRSASGRCRRPQRASAARTSARYSSLSRSTSSRSASWPSGSTRPAERSARPSRTPGRKRRTALAASELGVVGTQTAAP